MSGSSSTSLSSSKTPSSASATSKGRKPSSANSSGAVNEEAFFKAFSDVPQLNVWMAVMHVHIWVLYYMYLVFTHVHTSM